MNQVKIIERKEFNNGIFNIKQVLVFFNDEYYVISTNDNETYVFESNKYFQVENFFELFVAQSEEDAINNFEDYLSLSSELTQGRY